MICTTYLFGFVTGLFHLVHVWINYCAYASLHYCATSIVAFCAVMELMMLFMQASQGSYLHETIFENTTSQAVFYMLFLYALVKLIASFRIYKEFRKATYGSNIDDDNFYQMSENDEEARLREEQLNRQRFARNEQDLINQQQRQQQFVGVPPQEDDQPRRLNGAAPRDFADFEDSKETVAP